MWTRKAEELDRMVRIGYTVWREDLEQLKASVRGDSVRGDNEKPHDPPPPSTVTVSFFLAAFGKRQTA